MASRQGIGRELWRLVEVIVGALALGAIAPNSVACDMPPLVVIPAKDEVGGQAPVVSAATNAYFEGMKSYVACVQAELAKVGGDNAPPGVKAAFAARNNAAVAEATAVKDLFEANVGSARPSPASEAPLRKLVEGLMSGMPDYTAMTPEMVSATKMQLTHLQRDLAPEGAIQRIEFRGVDNRSHDVYEVHHERGSFHWLIGLSADRKIEFAFVTPSTDRK